MGLAGSGNPKLTALWQLDVNQAITIVTRALDDNDGDVRATAKALHIGETALKRWIRNHPALKANLEKIRDEVARLDEGSEP